MADVHLAVQLGDQGFTKLVVEKRGRGSVCRRPELGRAFLAEARLLARVSHPNVVQVLDLGRDDGVPFVVVEYLSGETLSTVLRQVAAAGDRMPWPLVLRAGAGLAAALAAAHGARDPEGARDPILHRDLTPSNVIVCYAGGTKVIDFGIARLVAEAGDTRTGTVKGKLSYLAPELLEGKPADPRSDLFQLGIVLHESLTGERLFDASSDAARIHAVLHRPIQPPCRQVEGLPSEVDRIVLGLLERDPARRASAAETVRADLEEVLRRSGARASEHDLGAWLRAALPVQLAERRQRERDCIRALAGNAADDRVTIRRPRPRGALRRRALGIAALVASGALGLGGGAWLGRATGGHDAGAEVAAAAPVDAASPPSAPNPEAAAARAAVPAPMVRPLEVDEPRPAKDRAAAPGRTPRRPSRAARRGPRRDPAIDPVRDRLVDPVEELAPERAPPPAWTRTDNVDPWRP